MKMRNLNQEWTECETACFSSEEKWEPWFAGLKLARVYICQNYNSGKLFRTLALMYEASEGFLHSLCCESGLDKPPNPLNLSGDSGKK